TPFQGVPRRAGLKTGPYQILRVEGPGIGSFTIPAKARKIKSYMAQTYAAKYLMKAALSAPRDLVNSYVARFKPIYPTVLIFNCTFVCDARCEMCSNWQRGDRKSDMSLEQVDRVFQNPLWKNVE